MTITLKSNSDELTREIGKKLGSLITGKLAIALYGDLAAGKTTFVQGFARGLDVSEEYYITSPTYNIINEYPGRITLYHMDLYRLGSADELEYIGLDDIAASESVMIIEWPDIINDNLIEFDLTIHITTDPMFNRDISLIPSGLGGSNLLMNFSV